VNLRPPISSNAMQTRSRIFGQAGKLRPGV